jgi:transposase
LAVSRHTLLRLLRRLPLSGVATPRVLGVDDWAYRQRQIYGTILIDLERRRPLALWPDREAETFALWLQAHPGVHVITRDRSRAYADGARQGAPEAMQVADRFHLLQNLAEALDQVFNAHSHALEAVNAALRQAPVPQPDGTVAVPVPPPSPPRIAQDLAHQRRARRLALYQQIWALHRQGWPGQAIATQLSIGKNTVFRYLRTPTCPERKRRSDRGRSILTPYIPYLLERWNTGHRDALRLFRERQPDQLDPWLARAADSPLVPLQRFAKGLRDDYDAVKAGLTLPWSNGPVEGHMNRLKTLKRQMFGRAGLDLLQRRFLLAA